jgi:hypothetical protein
VQRWAAASGGHPQLLAALALLAGPNMGVLFPQVK